MARFETADVKPGLYRVPDAEYRALRALNQSSIKKAANGGTPMHVYHAWTQAGDETRSMRIGTVAHAILLEPHTVEQRFVVAGTYSRKKTKEMAEEGDAREVLTAAEWNDAQGIAGGIARNPTARALLGAPGHREVSAVWRDGPTGFTLKGKFDFVASGVEATWVDVKTSEDASPDGFSRAIASWRYDIQAAMGIDGFKAITGRQLDPVFVVVENRPPYCCAVYRMNDRTINAGRVEYRAILARLREADRTGEYEYGSGVEPIDAPDWMLKRYGTPGWA